MNRFLFLIGLAFTALADSIRGRSLAINETIAPAPESVPLQGVTDQQGNPLTPAPLVTVGLPKDVDPQKVLERKIALVRAGTEPLVAEKLAIDAESQQAMRDQGLRAEVRLKQVPVTQTVAEVTSVRDETLNASSGSNLEEMTVAQLTDLAGKNSYDLGGATKKADIIAAIEKARAA